ncbi:MAG: hypothetical protein OXC62_17385, partial [Aestuariivita sp.]|nr:hypothetical protein [Aestuariivita sp.]
QNSEESVFILRMKGFVSLVAMFNDLVQHERPQPKAPLKTELESLGVVYKRKKYRRLYRSRNTKY